MTKRELPMDLVPIPDSINPQCQIPLSGETPEVDLIAQNAINQHHNDLMSVADFLYQLAFGILVKNIDLNFLIPDSYTVILLKCHEIKCLF